MTPDEMPLDDFDAAPATALSRRGFLRTAGALGVLAGLERLTPAYARPVAGATGRWQPRGAAAVSAQAGIDLTISEAKVGIGTRRALATTINGTVPGPLLRFREGEDAVIRVTNTLKEDTSVHWHGLIVPNGMDGVPGVTFPGIKPRETFTYTLPLRQYGTYWYHSHSGLQEQAGHYGPLIIDPVEPEPFTYDREYVVMLSDWSFEDPYEVLDHLKKNAAYYAYQRRTVPDFFKDVRKNGWSTTVKDRLAWAKMRMSPTDISDITGATYTYLMNGLPPASNWTGLFRPGERVRLRFINAGGGTYFDVRIPGLEMTVVAVSGQYVQPMVTDEFRMEIAQTYDVIVQPTEDHAYTIFAESMDRSGYTHGTLAPRAGLTAPIPRRRARPTLLMGDMGMAAHDMSGMDMGGTEMVETTNLRATPLGGAAAVAGGHAGMPGMAVPELSKPAAASVDSGSTSGDAAMAGHDMAGTAGSPPAALAPRGKNGRRAPGTIPDPVEHTEGTHGPGNSSTPMQTRSRLEEPGSGLGKDGWRVLVYTDLKALKPRPDALREPEREIDIHLTGNMERYMWSMDGVKFSDVKEPIRMTIGERVRLTMINDTMMSHPMHLHGMWMELENGAGAETPLVHTINVKPAERLSVLVTPNDPGPWAFHCHVLLHMEMGMFRLVDVTAAKADAIVAAPEVSK